MFTGVELRYDYGFPHAEWRRNLQASGIKSNKDNIEAADSKNKISRKVEEPFITVTRKKKLETLFQQSGPEKEKPGDSEKSVASTTQRKGKESEVPVKEVSNLYPKVSAKNLTIPLQPVSLQSCNEFINIEIQNAADTVEKAPNPSHNIAGDTEQRISTKSSQNNSSKVEKNKTTDTEEKAPNPLRQDGDTEPRISTKSSQNQSSKVEKNKTTDTEENALNPLRKDGDTEQRISTKSSQNQSSKVEKNKTTDTEEKASNPLRKGGDTEPRISTKSSQNKSGKVEKNKTTDTEAKAPKQPRKPKNVTRSIEASYAKLTKLEERKPKTPFEVKNECIIPQKVSTISLITRLRLEITDFLNNFFIAFAPQSESNLMAFMPRIH